MTNDESQPAMMSVADESRLRGDHLKSDAVKPKYVIVTPVRDEETYLPFTIQSIVKRMTVREGESNWSGPHTR